MDKDPAYGQNSRKCSTLWVGDLEPEVDEKYLRSVFGQNHNVKGIHIYKDKITNGKVNYAFLEFESADIAEKVLNYFNGKEKPRYGKPFKINWGNQKSRQNRPMFGGRPAFGHGPPFHPMGGFNPRMPPMMPGMMGMRAMYPNMPMGPGMFPPHMMQPHKPNSYGKKHGKNPNVISIYVGELDTFCEQHNLVDFFKTKYKSVVGGKIIKDFQTKKNKGYGFVHFEDQAEADNAIKEMNGVMFMGRRIKTGRSFSKSQIMRMQNHRNHMFTMMNRGMHPMAMGMGMRGPMMPYHRDPRMMGRSPMDQNRHKNMGSHMKGRGPYHSGRGSGGFTLSHSPAHLHSHSQGHSHSQRDSQSYSNSHSHHHSHSHPPHPHSHSHSQQYSNSHSHKGHSRAIDHYRKNSRKSSHDKKPNYMISSNQERSHEKKGYESRKSKYREHSERDSKKKRDRKMDLKIVDEPKRRKSESRRSPEKEKKREKEKTAEKKKGSGGANQRPSEGCKDASRERPEKNAGQKPAERNSPKEGKRSRESGAERVPEGFLRKRGQMELDRKEAPL